jgi:hypothetical protein
MQLEVPRPLELSIHTSKNEGQVGKIGLFKGCVYKERLNECEYDGCTLYSCMKIEE